MAGERPLRRVQPIADLGAAGEHLEAVGHVQFAGPVAPEPGVVPVESQRPALPYGNLQSDVHQRSKEVGAEGEDQLAGNTAGRAGKDRSTGSAEAGECAVYAGGGGIYIDGIRLMDFYRVPYDYRFGRTDDIAFDGASSLAEFRVDVVQHPVPDTAAFEVHKPLLAAGDNLASLGNPDGGALDYAAHGVAVFPVDALEFAVEPVPVGADAAGSYLYGIELGVCDQPPLDVPGTVFGQILI